MGDLVTRFPWEPVPVAETVKLLQQDFAFAVQYTAVMVHSTHDELQIVVNTKRGQIVPRGECKFTDGTTFEFLDIGMPQVGAPVMTVRDLMTKVLETAQLIGLELT